MASQWRNTMNSITRSQLTAILLITDIFSLICLNGGISAWTMAGYAVGTALQMIVMLLLSSVRLPKWLSLAYLIFFGSIQLKRLWSASDVTFIPSEASSGIGGKAMMTILIAAVCLYISSTGMKAAARSASIAAAVGVLFLLTDLTSALIHPDFANISASSHCGTFSGGLLLSITASGPPVAFLTLLPLVKNGSISAVLQYYSVRITVCTTLLLTTLLVAGGIMETLEFPVITAAQLSQPFSAQRIDPLFLMLFAVFGVFSLTAQAMTAAYLFREIFPRFRKWRSTAVIGMILSGAAAAVIFTGCTSSGLVHDKLYLRSIAVSNDKVTMTFFADEESITVGSGELPTAEKMAELCKGKPIVTGFTEMIVLGDCDAQQVLEELLTEWKVSPSCMAVYSASPHDTLTEGNAEMLEGTVKEAEKLGIAGKCKITAVLSELINKGRSETAEINRNGFLNKTIIHNKSG